MGGRISGPVAAIIIAIVVIIVGVIGYKVVFTNHASMTPQAKAFQDAMKKAHTYTKPLYNPNAPNRGLGSASSGAAQGYPAAPSK
ncbi:MAG TPA: hypothetical protein VFJ58_01910 [Armatimonadota bacterium]|nr:hypothetical protein [Armatimonadota bacterium]